MLNYIHMAEIIGVKQLYKNLRDIAKRAKAGESFVVVKHATPLFRIVPSEQDATQKPFTLRDVIALRFRSGEKKLHEKIDEIVYKT